MHYPCHFVPIYHTYHVHYPYSWTVTNDLETVNLFQQIRPTWFGTKNNKWILNQAEKQTVVFPVIVLSNFDLVRSARVHCASVCEISSPHAHHTWHAAFMIVPTLPTLFALQNLAFKQFSVSKKRLFFAWQVYICFQWYWKQKWTLWNA